MKKLLVILSVGFVSISIFAGVGRDWFVLGGAWRWDFATNAVEVVVPDRADTGAKIRERPIVDYVYAGSSGPGTLEFYEVHQRYPVAGMYSSGGLMIGMQEAGDWTTNRTGVAGDIFVCWHSSNRVYTVETALFWDQTDMWLFLTNNFRHAMVIGDEIWHMTNTLTINRGTVTNAIDSSGSGLFSGNGRGPVLVRISGTTNLISLPIVSGRYL